VLAESFERIHRANLVGVGILPVTFVPEMNRKTLGLTGRERFSLGGLRDGLSVGGRLQLKIIRENSAAETVPVIVNLETGNEIHILRTGGLLPFLLHKFAAAS
jgi:aconitase A